MRNGNLSFAASWACRLLLCAPPALALDANAPVVPIKVGETLAEVLRNLGERAGFGADCGTWTGSSVDTTLVWGGMEFTVMGLLRENRVAAVRIEQAVRGIGSVSVCDASLDDFSARWQAWGYSPGPDGTPLFDGPVQGSVRDAFRRGERVGRFESEFRASRAQCRVALILSSTAP